MNSDESSGKGLVVVSPAQAARAAQFPAAVLRRGISLDTKRPLTELTGDTNVWNNLHKYEFKRILFGDMAQNQMQVEVCVVRAGCWF